MTTTSALNTVFVAGIGNSEPDHWQSLWARTTPRSIWVEQRDWDNPIRDEWVRALQTALATAAGPKVLVAHSLGCLLVATAADTCRELGAVGAFLVSVPDVTGPKFPSSAIGFPAAESTTLPFPSLVLASTDDPYGSLTHAERSAKRWNSKFVSVGAKGHINLASNVGEWREGRDLLRGFSASLITANAS